MGLLSRCTPAPSPSRSPDYGDAPSGKILVDITNPFNADASGLVTTAGDSMSQRIAAAAPEDTYDVKAFNAA